MFMITPARAPIPPLRVFFFLGGGDVFGFCCLYLSVVVWCRKQPLLTFKAGKMKVVDKGGNKFHITPDLRKGTISLFKGPDDQLMHFAWKERPSGTVVDVSPLFEISFFFFLLSFFFLVILIFRCFGISHFRDYVIALFCRFDLLVTSCRYFWVLCTRVKVL